jgi:hypothetical protein
MLNCLQLSHGIAVQITADKGRICIFVDGIRQAYFDDSRCSSQLGQVRFCSGGPPKLSTKPGRLVLGGPQSADITLDHLRLYAYPLPQHDLGGEALCTSYGDCSAYGVQDWRSPEVVKEVPKNAFVPPSLLYVPGAFNSVQRITKANNLLPTST